jgi:hypothetical protein
MGSSIPREVDHGKPAIYGKADTGHDPARCFLPDMPAMAKIFTTVFQPAHLRLYRTSIVCLIARP